MTETTNKSRLPRTVTLVLIAVVLLIGGGALMVWLPYHRERQVIVEIERLGGQTGTVIVRPFWIPDAVDDRYLAAFERVSFVDLSGTQVSDAGLEQLRGLMNLRQLDLDDTQITGAGLKHLHGLTNLHWLMLEDTQISDAGLEHLKELKTLTLLLLSNTQFTEVGVKRLQKSLPGCKIGWILPAE